MKELKNFKSTKKIEDNKNISDGIDKRLKEEDVQKIIDERSGKTEEELMKELKAEVNKSKKEGKFSKEEVQNFKNTVLPFLSAEQKDKLDEILKIIT